jgi:hypothetical protein
MPKAAPDGAGDTWTWTAIDAEQARQANGDEAAADQTKGKDC